MRCIPGVIGVAALLLGTLVVRGEDKVAGKGAADLQGTWTFINAEENGKILSPEEVQNDYAEIKGDRITIYSNHALRAWEIRYTADRTKNPATLDMEVIGGEDQGRTAKGIYSLANGQLRLCYCMDAKKAPEEFSSKSTGEGRAFCFTVVRPSDKRQQQ